MSEKDFFNKPLNTDISVATIGINRDDWYCHRPGMKREAVRETMIREKYDVVPIVNGEGVFEKYFTLNQSDNSRLDFNEIRADERLYYLTHVRDAIWKMKTARRTHYFLSNGRTENDIVGLLSLSNFNCREFYVFLFHLISYIEREFAALVISGKDAGFAILSKQAHTKELKDQLKIIQQRFEEDEDKGIENDYKEYLYLHHLIWLVKAENQFTKLGYKNGEAFENGTSVLKDIRNNIAHPVRSLVRNLKDLDNLDTGLNKLYEFKGRLDEYLKRVIAYQATEAGTRRERK